MKTNEHIIKEFERVNANLRKQLRELQAKKQSLEQMLQAQQDILNQRNAMIAELESELSVKEGLLNIRNGLTGKIFFPCENKKVAEEVLNIDTEGIRDSVHRFGIEYCQKCIRGNDRKKEFNEICDMFNDYMREYSKGGVIRFLAELTQKLREDGVAYTVESLDGEISVNEVEIEKHTKIKELQSKLDESVEAERNLCEEIEKLEAEKRENRDKMFPYERIEQMKEKIEKLNDRHQSDCIEKTQLHTALDVMTEKYQRLRNVHGL